MGTSASHSGPKSGISLDPPWLNDIPLELSPTTPPTPQPTISPIAPPSRYKGARLSLTDYAKSGNKESLSRSLGHYTKTGMGGARKVADRMQTSTKAAAGIFSALRSLDDGSLPSIAYEITQLQSEGASIYSIIDVFVRHVCPDGGSLDETSVRDSASSALSELFEKRPDADIISLSNDDCWLMISSFLGYEAFSRIQLDIGQTFEKMESLSERIFRLHEMREYLESEITAQINSFRNTSPNSLPSNLHELLDSVIEGTFRVFEVSL
jgi:hypothetical protein